MSTVDQIIERWPLAAMLARCNISVPSRGKFCSPFRPDNNPSCEIYGETIRDRSTGESLDSIRVFAEHKGLSNSEAIRELYREIKSGKPLQQLPQRQQQPPKHKLVLPYLHYSIEEADQLARLRGLSAWGVDFAGFMGTLAFADLAGFQCWILSDGDKKLAEARRMDGEKFPEIGLLGERKAHTLRVSCKSWPLGMNSQGVNVPAGLPVWLVEGGPDYLAACDVLMHSPREFLPVSMLGSSQRIHSDALPFFRGRDVRILGHPGDAGLKAAMTWAEQLIAAGASVRTTQLKGGDLNELVTLHCADAVATRLNDEHATH